MNKTSTNAAKQPLYRKSATLIASVTVATSLLSGCFGESPEQQVVSAKKLLEKNDPKAAIIQLKNALQQKNSLAEARFLLGKALMLGGDVPGALIELAKAKQGGYDSDELKALMARALLAKGEVDRVLTEFDPKTLQDPVQRAELSVVQAGAHMAKRDLESARRLVEAALRDDPRSASAGLAKARLLVAEKDLPGALQALDDLLKQQPKNVQAWRSKAELLQVQPGDHRKEAMEAYRQALNLDGKDVAAHAGLVGLLMQQRDAAGAAKQLEAMQKVAPNHPQTRYHAAMIALEKRDLKAAEEQAQLLLKAVPDSPQALHLAGMVDFQLGAYQKATTELGMALQGGGANPAVRMLLAQSQLHTGDPAKALQTLEPLLSESNGVPEAFALAAEAYQQSGDPAAAQALYAKLLKLDPKNAQGRIAVAQTQIERGNVQQGLDALRAMAKDQATDVKADMALINALLHRKEFGPALQAIDQLERKQPGKPLPLMLRGRVEAASGHPDKAKLAYEQALKLDPANLPAATALAGFDLLEKKREDALKRFEGVAKANPSSVDARLAVIGLRMQNGGTRDKQIADLEALVKEFPKEAAPLLAQGATLVEAGRAGDAIAVAQKGRQTFPGNASFLDLLGRAQVANKDLNQAVSAFAEHARMQPQSPVPLLRQAEVQVRLKDNPGAISLLRKALALKADYLPAKTLLASLLTSAGQSAEARQIAKSLQQQPQTEVVGLTLAGDVETAARNFAAAADAYKAGLAKQESSELAAKLYHSYRLLGRDKEAQALESSWLAKHPSDAGFLSVVAERAMTTGDLKQAAALYRKVLESQPGSLLALNNLVWVMDRLKDPETKAQADKLLALAPNAPAVLDTVAGVYAGGGQKDKALELQRKAVALAPDLHLHRLHLAQFLLAGGKKDEARRELSQLADLGKDFAQQAEVQRLLEQVGGKSR
ncbi:XrtA/PEP-CTERM system TPR-repeat protein PrsT [Pelomonas sp. SE-A7]|uniref:XrtA/PEP-CTERM system TPR-repeat protein PrsT n=1 Tax=Pelomonas sp. SE-A7 TaxID=3054953 RepID=UPI00259D11DF|nr:XrtA/PEP-CTERM system TPR-repeat protein PrsT [Pelomonas sp. SE-A7]MDM4764861.1 PEP-CTERM system TPR-repeat protein PrsT [Pelomonas sp. SE-A7]